MNAGLEQVVTSDQVVTPKRTAKRVPSKPKSGARTGPTAATPACRRIDWVPFFTARRILEERFQSSLEEIAVWISFGADAGGLDGYLDAPMHEGAEPTDLATLPRCSFDELKADVELLPHLVCAYFDRDALKAFAPRERYLTFQQALRLLLPLAGDDRLAQALLRARTAVGELVALHPITVVTQHTHGHGDDPAYAKLEDGMFQASAIEKLIDSNFPDSKTTYRQGESTSERDKRLQARAKKLFEDGLKQKPSKRHSKNYVCKLIYQEEQSRSEVTFDRLMRVVLKPKSSIEVPAPAAFPNLFSKKS